MDKRTIALAVLCIVLAFAWPAILHKFYPAPPPAAAPSRSTNQVALATNEVAPTNAAAPLAEAPAAPPEAKPALKKSKAPRPPEQELVLENDLVKLVFTSYGGGIKRVELKQYAAQQDASHQVILNQFGKAPMGEVHGLEGFDEDTVFELRRTDSSVALEATNEAGVRLVKQFHLGGDYLIDGEFTLVNGSRQPLDQAQLAVALGTASAVVPSDKFEIPYVDWSTGEKTTFIDVGAFSASWLTRRPARDVVQTNNVHLAWAGIEDRFFCALWMPQVPAGGGVSATREIVAQPGADVSRPRPSDYGINGVMTTPSFHVAAGDSYKYAFRLYAGPKEYRRLQALDQKQTDVMHWGWVEWIGELLLKTMGLIHKLVPSYFFVIIIITLVIKMLFWPLTAMSNRSMKAMQALQPKMAALREKFKDDPQKLNSEMMRLYKEHKVNPMAGCLPTVVQIPVFIGFYYMLRSAIELRMHGFLWIHDLSQPDSVAQIGAFFINPLPILMGLTMIWQMKVTPTAGDPSQQKMMMFMPLMFLFFCYGMPSGLVLYWTVQNLFTILQMTLTRQATVPGASGALPGAGAKSQKSKPR